MKPLLLLLLFVVPTAAQKVIRWGHSDLPKECCKNYMYEGSLQTIYRDEKLGYAVSLHPDLDDKYVVALIFFQNTSDSPITVYPAKFSLSLLAPVNKTFPALDVTDVAREMNKRGRLGRVFRGFIAGMARRNVYATSTHSGDLNIRDTQGNSASGTYEGDTKTTVSTPDYQAQRNAARKNAEEREANEARSEHIRTHALRSHTLFKDDMYGGLVFFKKDKITQGAVLSFVVEDVVYEVPYGIERTK